MPLVPADALPPAVHCLTAHHHRDADRPLLPRRLESDRLPVVVHYAATDTTEVWAASVLEAVERAWDVQVDALGWRPPVLPDAADGPELDVYLVSMGSWAGYAVADGFVDDEPMDGFLGTSAYIVVDAELPAGWIDIYLAHEFNHVLQWATDFSEPSTNVWEATATAAQHWTLGPGGDWDADVADFQDVPWMPVLYGDGAWLAEREGIFSLYEYGAAVWPMVLDASQGGDGTVGPRLWAALAGRRRDVVDGVEAVTGRPLVDFLLDVAVHRLPEPLPGGPPRNVGWPPPAHEVLSGPGEVRVEAAVTGQAFVRLTDLERPVRVAATTEAGVDLGLVAVTADGVIRETSPGEVTLDAPEAWVAVVNAGPDRSEPYRMAEITISAERSRRGCGGSRSGLILAGLGALLRRRRGRQGTFTRSRPEGEAGTAPEGSALPSRREARSSPAGTARPG